MTTAEKTRATDITHPARKRRSRKFDEPTPLGLVLRYAALIGMLLIAILPMLWELSTSLKGVDEDIYSLTPQLFPQHPSFESYGEVQRAIPIFNFAGNSIAIATINIVGNLVFTTLAGYALARLQFRGRKLVLGLIVSTLILPGEASIIAQYLLIIKLGLGDQLLGVALPSMCGMINILLMRNAFLALPKEIDEAAIIDGANAWQRLTRIALPHVTGTMSVIAIMTFIGAWDDFLWPLLVLNSPDKLTFTVGLAYLNNHFSDNPRAIAAGTIMAIVPILIIFVVLQRYFFRGVGEGAIKG